MPYYYSSSNTPVKEAGYKSSGRQISLSLKDLDTSVGSIRSERVSFDENYPANKTPEQRQQDEYDILRSSYQEVDQHEQQYQQNVNILLNKSSGSKYEEMIKKFLLSQDRRERDEGVISQTLSGAPPRTPDNIGKSRHDISLVDSSSKAAEKIASRQRRAEKLRQSQELAETIMQQEVMSEVLAVPLERNKYVPPDRSGAPTNLLGRQRAAPRSTHSQSPSASHRKSKKPNHFHSAVKSSTDVGGPRSVTVSIADFNEWIDNNKSWREKVALKKQQKKNQKQQQDNLSIRSPNLSKRVQLHAERSYIRKHSLSRGRSPGVSSNQSRLSFRSPSPSPRPDSRSHDCGGSNRESQLIMQLDELEDSHSAIGSTDADGQGNQQSDQPPVSYEKDVFQRLYNEGKQYNDFNATMDEHRSKGRFKSNEMSFSPRINKKSSALMRERGTAITSLFRSCSPSSYRMSDISFEERQQHATQKHKHRVRSMSPANQRRQARESVTLRGSTVAKSYLSTKGGKMYPEAVVSSILADGKVSDILCSSRNKSIQNASTINQERKRISCDYETLSDGGNMFEPRMMSKESKRINSRDDTSFEDRMLKSMDEYRIKVKVNKEAAAVTPGPGQYNNTKECNRCCPLPRDRHSTQSANGNAHHSKSPGSGSYSFGRARRSLI